MIYFTKVHIQNIREWQNSCLKDRYEKRSTFKGQGFAVFQNEEQCIRILCQYDP